MRWLIALLMTLPLACASGSEGITRLEPNQFEAKLNSMGSKVLLIDVRTPEEFAQGHIKGALLINIYDPNFEKKINELPKDKPVMVYCRSSNRSMQAVPVLQKAGFKEIMELKGGISAWYAANKPTIR